MCVCDGRYMMGKLDQVLSMAEKLSQYFAILGDLWLQKVHTKHHKITACTQHSLFLLPVLVVCIFKIDIYRKQVTVEQHMKEILIFGGKKA